MTTQQLERSIGMVKELFESRLDASDTLFRAKLEAMETAIRLLQSHADRSASINVVEQKVDSLDKLHLEKFASVQTQFLERDIRTDKMAEATKIAVDAALQAAKEAVGKQNESSAESIKKSETATMKQLDQLVILIQSSVKAIDDKFNQQSILLQASQDASNDKFADVKDRIAVTDARITTIEGRGIGIDRAATTMGQHWGFIFGGVMMVIAIITVVMLILTNIRKISS